MTAEALVLDLVAGANKPYSVQGVSDMLATKGVKKAAAEKALDALVDKAKLVRKEFGKTKLYIPSQEGLAALAPDEAAALEERAKALQAQLSAEEEAVMGLKRELAAANQALSPEQIEARIAELEGKQAAAEAKLQGLRGGGARLVSSTDVEKVEKAFTTLCEAWARHRRQFRSAWDSVSDGLEGKEEVLFEEIGVDSDKMVGADFEGAKALLQPIKKMRR